MIKFYYSLAPNPMKVALFLEEAGLPYEAMPVDTRKGEQFSAGIHSRSIRTTRCRSSSTATPPCSTATPSCSTSPKRPVSSCRANTPKARGELLSWLMFVATGIGPYSGQAVHFSRFAPEPKEYAVNRYVFEAQAALRHRRRPPGQHEYMLGETYTIVDMALWGWARLVPFVLGEEALPGLPNLKRLLDTIDARPAAARALALKDRHTFKAEFDEEAKRHMFRHTVQAA